jgi:hypothetical protein
LNNSLLNIAVDTHKVSYFTCTWYFYKQSYSFLKRPWAYCIPSYTVGMFNAKGGGGGSPTKRNLVPISIYVLVQWPDDDPYLWSKLVAR